MDTHVHYHDALTDHVSGNALGVAGGDDKDVGHAGDAGDVSGAEVADGDRGVGPGLFLEEEGSQGSAHYETATHYHNVLALRVMAHGDEHTVDAGRGAGDESGLTGEEPAHV